MMSDHGRQALLVLFEALAEPHHPHPDQRAREVFERFQAARMDAESAREIVASLTCPATWRFRYKCGSLGTTTEWGLDGIGPTPPTSPPPGWNHCVSCETWGWELVE